jgi:hypothetical protein
MGDVLVMMGLPVIDEKEVRHVKVWCQRANDSGGNNCLCSDWGTAKRFMIEVARM